MADGKDRQAQRLEGEFDAERRGRLTRRPDGATLEFDRVLRAPPERVWEALTTVEQLRIWNFAPRVVFDPGTRIEFWWGSEMNGGAITAWEPERRLSFEWDALDPPSTVSFLIEPAPEGTRLRLVHERLREGDGGAGTLTGWHTHLVGLRWLLAGETVAFEATFDALGTLYGARRHAEYQADLHAGAEAHS